MYIPKNRIITDLKTSPNEFVYKGTNTFYNGPYWKSYDGKFFTGKNPNEIPTQEIEPNPIMAGDRNITSPLSQTSILFIDYVETPSEGITQPNLSIVGDYSILKKIISI